MGDSAYFGAAAMNSDRVQKIMQEETAETMRILAASDLPADVQALATSAMEATIASIDAWARKQNSVIDGRVCVAALELLHDQQRRIMQRVLDERIGPKGPNAN